MRVRLDRLVYVQDWFDPARVVEYAARSTPLPPISVVWNQVVDGRHRCLAAMLRGDAWIEAQPVGEAPICADVMCGTACNK
jgi:hypothetical protein